MTWQTHDVFNQFDELTDYDVFGTDAALVEAVRRAGARKVIFGSDGPWLHPGVELHKIRALGLAPRDERLVLSGNLLRLM